ncbi:MAG: hypothetical protein A3E84_01895 [Gammaproteobacteria bacterium RIFCSPHIGHO2_12_FULL_42_13]|nr:MAG: hypothetical protein A3E84_01895 [Gammaproteobacteria bacterium RIFCSPHIGHO2_12_FULL_42_13]
MRKRIRELADALQQSRLLQLNIANNGIGNLSGGSLQRLCDGITGCYSLKSVAVANSTDAFLSPSDAAYARLIGFNQAVDYAGKCDTRSEIFARTDVQTLFVEFRRIQQVLQEALSAINAKQQAQPHSLTLFSPPPSSAKDDLVTALTALSKLKDNADKLMRQEPSTGEVLRHFRDVAIQALRGDCIKVEDSLHSREEKRARR